MAASDSVASLASASTSAEKPYLLFAIPPFDGHTMPTSRIAAELVKRGYEITFIGGEQFEDMLRRIGTDFVGIPDIMTPEHRAKRNAIPAGLQRELHEIKRACIDVTPERWDVLKSQLERLRAEKPGREIIVVTETMFMGANPLVLGAPLPKGFHTRPKVINIQTLPYLASSIDTGPPCFGLPPDATESGRARNRLLYKMIVDGPCAGIIAEQDRMLKALGCTKELAPKLLFHHWVLMHDKVLQLCPPSLEYPRCDMPSHVVFTGCPTPKPLAPDFEYPEWWGDFTQSGRKLVVVTQGTVANNYSDLLVPALTALADRDDLLVVAILGHRGAALLEDVAIPSNARVIDHIPYDAVLPYASVFVMNAGYGGFLHGITNGVPMVLAGETEDKPEVAMRGAWSGVAVNLQTGRPSSAAVRVAVDQILADKSFKRRIDEVRRENEAMSVFDSVEREILSV